MKTIKGMFDGEIVTVLEATPDTAFRGEMSDAEKEEFRQWGREHRGEPVKSIYHPLVQTEMLREIAN
jgi:hypothetical protein